MKNVRKRVKQVQTHRPPVTENEKIWSFGVAIRRAPVLERVREFITDELFHDHELWLRLVWRVVVDFHTKWNKLPSKQVIKNMCSAAITLNPDVIAEGDGKKVSSFISTAFNFTDEDMDEPVVVEVIQRFIEDRLMYKGREELSMPQTPLSLAAAFGAMQEKAAAAALLSSNTSKVPFPSEWFRRSKIGERSTTQLTFLDRLMGGGAAPGETYGIMGPYGAGKSTLAVMLSVSHAHAEFIRWETTGCVGVPGRSYHFFYEDTLDDIRLLALSYLAEIPKERLASIIHGQDFSLLSTAGNYEPYELKRFKKQLAAGSKPPGELERYGRVQEILNACWRPFDMTGGDPDNPGRGHGMVDEMASIVRWDTSASGAHCLSATADYVNAAVDAHFRHTSRDRNEFRTAIKGWQFEMKGKIAIPFNCWTWSMQQLNSESNAAKPGHLPKMTDAAECKAFAENCDFCFVMGIPTRGGQLPFVARKHRRAQCRISATVLTLRGDLARFVDSHETWEFDEGSNAIVRKDESGAI